MMREGVKEPDFDGNVVKGQCFYLLAITVKANA